MSGTRHDEACKAFAALLEPYEPLEPSTWRLEDSQDLENVAKVASRMPRPLLKAIKNGAHLLQ